jgi:SAM-dependent methyltransferase
MKNYDPVMSFDADAAARYDSRLRGDEDAAVAFQAEAAGGGVALELAIGTGRIALPLAARGVSVHGIDLSPHMLEQLREKPSGDQIPVTLGDYSLVPVDGRFSLIYIVYNTIFNLLTQDEQVRCFENVAAHLADDGVFVVETFTPGHLNRLRDNQYVDAEALNVNEVTFDVARHDPIKQLLIETHVTINAGGARLNPIVCRYIWPSEMDLMARIAGLRLKERWGNWERQPFTADSRLHVSVYGREFIDS